MRELAFASSKCLRLCSSKRSVSQSVQAWGSGDEDERHEDEEDESRAEVEESARVSVGVE